MNACKSSNCGKSSNCNALEGKLAQRGFVVVVVVKAKKIRNQAGEEAPAAHGRGWPGSEPRGHRLSTTDSGAAPPRLRKGRSRGGGMSPPYPQENASVVYVMSVWAWRSLSSTSDKWFLTRGVRMPSYGCVCVLCVRVTAPPGLYVFFSQC